MGVDGWEDGKNDVIYCKTMIYMQFSFQPILMRNVVFLGKSVGFWG
jgi:hypothetical protein